MLSNYLKIALRNLMRNRVYSAINILGLALGVACCLLLALYIQDEVSYDKHHKRVEDLYRIVSKFESDVVVDKAGAASPPIAMTLKAEIPEVEAAVRVLNPPTVAQNLIRYQENLFYESNGFLADSTLFDVFTYDLKEGNPKKALVEAGSVVLSERLAKKLFGNEPALDKMISISQGGRPREYKVTGVFLENYNSHIKSNFFISMTSPGWGEYVLKEKEWAGQNFVPSYLKLVPGHSKAAVTAKATKRAAEIGIRKTMGAFRSSLVRQILGEAMVIVFISIVISLVLVQLALPFFNQLTDKNISFNSENVVYFITASVILTIVTGLVAGSYPAFYLSSFEPAEVLKGKLNLGNSAGRFRQGLVVFQFMIAIALVCGIFIISRQLDFMIEKNLGFDAKAKIVLPLRTDEARSQYEAVTKEMAKNSAIKAVSGSTYIPGTQIWNDMMYYADGGNMDKAVDIQRNQIDAGFMELLNMKLIAGRTFTDNRKMESETKLILNQTAVAKLGFTPEKIVGQNLHFDWQAKKYDFQVIGVMEDYHQNSLHDEIKPILFEMADSTKRYNYIVAAVASTNFEQSIKSIEKTWKSTIHDTPFEYSFLDQSIQKQYDEDRRVSKIITSFGFIAMIICGLGLYGLSSYMAERRFKEIGIRKVMGASVPIAWYGMSKWLESFAYKISIEWIVFAMAGIVALAIALITVSFESIKSAMGNPVASLRSE
jgi:putative ABC transport system permease protein